jgi:hypothetical protein
MGHLELNPIGAVAVAKVRRNVNGEASVARTPSVQHPARLNARSRDWLAGTEEQTAARIAQRFAPGGPSVVSFDGQQFDQPAQPASTFSALPGLRTLVAILILVALFPSLTFGAIFWLGALSRPWSTTVILPERNQSTGAAQEASLATLPLSQPIQLQPTALSPTLTTPATLDATAGENIAFAIGLDHADTLPARSIIGVSGLPQGATLSSGRPYGDLEWNLRRDEIGDLRLALPQNASGESELKVRLVAPGGEILAGSETRLRVVAMLPPREVGETLPPPPSDPTPAETPSPPKTKIPHAAADEAQAKWFKAPTFANLRDGPSPSSAIIGVTAKGAKLLVIGRKRGWVKVVSPETSKSGWIYAGSAGGHSREAGGDSGSFWSSVAGW